MGKKNGGINDRNSGETDQQSHHDGNSGIDNRIGGEVLPDPPETLSDEQARQREHNARIPDRRNARVM